MPPKTKPKSKFGIAVLDHFYWDKKEKKFVPYAQDITPFERQEMWEDDDADDQSGR